MCCTMLDYLTELRFFISVRLHVETLRFILNTAINLCEGGTAHVSPMACGRWTRFRREIAKWSHYTCHCEVASEMSFYYKRAADTV